MKLRDLLARRTTLSRPARNRAGIGVRCNQSTTDLDSRQTTDELTTESVGPATITNKVPTANRPKAEINTILRELRRAARLTQLELALRTGISRVRLSQAECGYLRLSETECSILQSAIEQASTDRADHLRNRLALLGKGEVGGESE